MKGRIRFAALLLVFSMVIGQTSVNAFEIGEILGWGEWSVGEEEYPDRPRKEKTDNSGKTGQTVDDQSKKDQDEAESDDYYETLDIEEDGSYDTKDEVCAYLVQYHRLPSNYMTKKEARKHGWEGGALHILISGMCIGGDYFGNYDGLLLSEDGREYHECDIDTLTSSSRGAKRIVYSGDDDTDEWNIYYTENHYESFVLLWGEDDYDA